MRKNSLIKTIFVLVVVFWALYALYPTYQLYTMTPEAKIKLEDEGKMVSLVDKSIRLGLDLQGGMYLILEVDLPALLEHLADGKDQRFEELMTRVRSDFEMDINDRPVHTDDFLKLLEYRFSEAGVSLKEYWPDEGDSDKMILDKLKDEAKDAMDRSMEILTNRIDQFGVSEPSIQKVGAHRILIQLPGISDPDQAETLIGKTAQLQLRLLEKTEVMNRILKRIDETMARERGSFARPAEMISAEADKDTTSQQSETIERKDKVIGIGDLFGDAEIKDMEEAEMDEEESTASDSTLVVDERMFQSNPFLALLGEYREKGHEVSAPVENIKAVNRILERDDIKKIIPPDVEFVWASETYKRADRTYRDLFLLMKEAKLTGEYLIDAKEGVGQSAESAGRPIVSFRLNRQGARIIGSVSKKNINRRLAIVLDNRVISAPSIRSKLGANNQITGIGSMDEARMIAIVLKAGALPAPVRIEQKKTVGPSLGQDSIHSGQMAALIGICIVVLFMILYYRMAGLVADFALIMNLLVLLAVLVQFRFVLTLPGVAGVVLTIGMAVDANVLVFERIREELRTGKTVRASIDAGYSRAFTTILDANITTLLTALVLYQFGTGPVRGFAVTLSIGILVSMFTALFVTRLIFGHITARKILTKLSI